MPLSEYKRKRDFNRTPEPDGSSPQGPERFRFCLQMHQARSLHFDLRLELDGVLKSWAIPKGPSLDPTEKRLAIHVEDHPIKYLEFEGKIPQGQYGAGTMLLWDFGLWIPLGDARTNYEKGELKFLLDGHKLQGGWMLVKTGKTPAKKNQWLFFKERDSAARSKHDVQILNEYPNSVLSGLSLGEIESSDHPYVDHSKLEQEMETFTAPSEKSPEIDGIESRLSTSKHPASGKCALPKIIKPSLPSIAKTAPSGDAWIHEIKFDGYRMLCRIQKGEPQFLSRNGKDWTAKLKRLAKALKTLGINNGVLDGEVVMMADDGTTSFQQLQNRIGAGFDHQLRYYLFDVLYFRGHSVTKWPLVDRKQLLAEILEPAPQGSPLYFSEHIYGDGPTVFEQACKLGAEGIVSKRIDSKYVSGRITNWLKSKCLQSREFVVGGFTDPMSSRQGFGALVLGYYDENDELCYAGRVGTGFTDKTLRNLKKMLDSIRTQESPFDRGAEGEKKNVHWVEPLLVVEVEFASWTDDGLVRFPSYRGLRDDLSVEEIDVDAPHERGRHSGSSSGSAPVSSHDSTSELLETPGLEKLKLTNADRIVFPDAGITKLGVATYYAQAAVWMLPHVTGRPLSLLRCPKGCHEKCFFQKRAPKGLSDSVERIDLPTSEGSKSHLVIHDIVGLLALVQFGVLEFHVWGARADEPFKPDRMVFDLDPDTSVPWRKVCAAATEIKERLTDLGLISFVKTSGGKGVHIVVPIRRRVNWKTMKQLSDSIVHQMTSDSPGRFTNTSSLRARKGKIYVDCQRNVRGATSVAAYSTRARESAAISLPIGWNELATLPSADFYTLQNIQRRFQNANSDPWADVQKVAQSITKPMLKKYQVD